jgi:hypothetical protein
MAQCRRLSNCSLSHVTCGCVVLLAGRMFFRTFSSVLCAFPTFLACEQKEDRRIYHVNQRHNAHEKWHSELRSKYCRWGKNYCMCVCGEYMRNVLPIPFLSSACIDSFPSTVRGQIFLFLQRTTCNIFLALRLVYGS